MRDTDLLRPFLRVESITDDEVLQTEIITILDEVADRVGRTVRVVVVHLRFRVVGDIARIAPDRLIDILRVVPEGSGRQ